MFIEVRSATRHEVDDIAELAARTFALACPPDAPASDIETFIELRLSPRSFADYISDPQRQVAVALDEQRIVGYTMLVLEPPAEDIVGQLTVMPTAELSKIYVDPLHHGGAVARALLDDAVDCARESGRAGVWLGTNQANQRAQRFYAKTGFVPVGTRRFRLGNRWEDDFIYELVLSPGHREAQPSGRAPA